MSIGVLAKDGHILSFNNQPLEAKNYAPSTGAVAKKDINFYDYNGTILYSYELSELPLSALPDAPDHSGDEVSLTFQEWNWSLADINALTTQMDIGATYIPTDGKTHFLIHIEERREPVITFSQTVSEGVIWNFGDGTANQTVSGTDTVTVTHTYANAGDYDITVSANSGCTFGLPSYIIPSTIIGYTAYKAIFRKIFIGLGISSIGNYAFNNCYSLQSITISNSVRSVGAYVFQYCYSLQSVTIPDGVTSIGSSVFASCYSLQSIIIPNSVTSIGSSAFSYCYSLQSITISNSVKSIGNNAFDSCSSLYSITIPNSVTSIGSSAFSYCNSLQSITISNSVTSIGSGVFASCYSLQSIIIPNSVTSIGSSAFSYCYSLQSIIIPNSVTSIGSSAFSYCIAMKTFDFSSFTSVPTLANTNAFTNIPADCKILIPSALFDTWSTATNWSTYASYMQAV